MNIDFNTKPTYVYDDKHIKTKIKTCEDNITTHFYNKNGYKKVPEKKNTTQMFINNNSRFYPSSIWKISPPNIFRRM